MYSFFKAAFTITEIEEIELKNNGLTGLRISRYEGKRKESVMFNLLVEPYVGSKTINIILSYSTSFWEKSTAEKALKHYVEILEKVLKKPHIKIEDINLSHELLTIASKKQEGDFDF